MFFNLRVDLSCTNMLFVATLVLGVVLVAPGLAPAVSQWDGAWLLLASASLAALARPERRQPQ
ncbi:hypothetical protein [Streptomyces bluensis]|uniref:Uncharacterized protein n=1 Tax=Streptomyces bluensis TaxID=33897 RepID=A0ABW6UPE4_9ACTN